MILNLFLRWLFIYKAEIDKMVHCLLYWTENQFNVVCDLTLNKCSSAVFISGNILFRKRNYIQLPV